MILTQNGISGALVVAERWRAAVEGAVFSAPEGGEIAATLSIGIAEFQGHHETPEDLVLAADKALYRAKQRGRNCVEVDPQATLGHVSPGHRAR